MTAKEAVKSYSLFALGDGKKKKAGGCHEKTRFEDLERVRAVPQLSPEQMNDWEYFRTAWGSKMAEVHGGEWAKLFAEVIQKVLEELENERANALFDFIHRETRRVSGDIPALVFLGS